MVANSRPMKPVGVQASTAMVPPGRVTRTRLVGGPLVVRREHHADARQHDVERRVRQVEGLGVALAPVDLDAAGARGLPAGLEQARASGRPR
ncbi:hypothetical protein GCM10025868_13710 [Angustibacter aerolatus]|uniref:Uncharacterized protein n=1 Tax=Angustibacter aerolatus TaxID=1162965 RepID=A0ABQ6JH73_9ACTN|nr:hypothetical protein GCM10025868_13710 [Angustibacter aerolatus]